MSRKATAKNSAKTKAATAYIVVRQLPSEDTSYTEPDRVFADKKAAAEYADRMNRELRALVNPFDNGSADYLLKGGEKALLALVKKLKLPEPKKTKSYGYAYVEWEAWWNAVYFNMTDAQRDAIWDALNKFNWYKVKEVELE